MIKNRIELAEEFARLGFTKGAEIGVADGRYSEILCQTIPNLTLYAVDPWKEYDGNWRTNEEQKTAYQKAQERLTGYDARLIPRTSVSAYTATAEAGTIPDKSLDFVFIDGSHDFNNVMLDIILWTNKVRSGGIVSGHDYYKFRTGNVIDAVDAYTKANNIDLKIIPEATKVHHDDRVPCWYFIKK